MDLAWPGLSREGQVGIVLAAAWFSSFVFRASTGVGFAGMATAFCLVRWADNLERMYFLLIVVEAGVFLCAFFYFLLRARMQRLFPAPGAFNPSGALGVLFVLFLFAMVLGQKLIQI